MSTNDNAPVVFYSWQSDLPNKTNRGLIHEALEKACQDLAAELESAPRVDADTQGEPGSPDIAATILEKIAKATVVVADVSIIGAATITDSNPPRTRFVPNPNVMVELGYAKRALGPSRVIMVCNTAFGRVEDLPFDIRGKGVMAYSYKGDGEEKPAGARNQLRGRLKAALAAALEPVIASARLTKSANDADRTRHETEQFRLLRAERVQNVFSAPPLPLIGSGPLMVLQVVPAVSLDGSERIDLLHDRGKVLTELSPVGASGWRFETFVDSIVSTSGPPREPVFSYTRLFQSGALEHVAQVGGSNSGAQINEVAHASVRAFAKVVPTLAKLGLHGRYFVALDVLRTKGCRIVADRFPADHQGRPISQESLSPPHAIGENSTADHPPSLLKPALDWIWRAAGFENCFYYDDQGWSLPGRG